MQEAAQHRIHSRRTIRERIAIRLSCMPAKSKKQQMAAGAALAAKRGEQTKSSLKGASKSMADSMSEKELRDMAKTKRKSLPAKKTPSKSQGAGGARNGKALPNGGRNSARPGSSAA